MRIPADMRTYNFCSRECMGAAVHLWSDGGSGRSGIRADIGHYVRSTWESNYARILIAQGISYEYEPVTFRMGTVHYTPDFLVNGEWIEIKGWMRPNAAEKIRAFRAAYPAEHLTIIDGPAYRKLEQEWASRIPEWEYASGGVHAGIA